MKKLIFLIVISLVFGLGFITSSFLQNRSSETNNSSLSANSNIPPKEENYLGTGTLFKHFFVHKSKDEISFDSFEGMDSIKGGTIKKSDYPKLFETPDGGTYFISTYEINDKINNKYFALITKNAFSHGAYTEVYGIVFDPKEGTVVYESPDELAASSLASLMFLENNGVLKMETLPYYFYASCTQCKLRILDYSAYDPTVKKFVPVNNRYKADFISLQKEYDEVATNKCSYQGKIMDVDQIVKIAGSNQKCEDATFPSQLKPAPDDYITIGKFNQIRENINNVLAETRKSLLTNTNP